MKRRQATLEDILHGPKPELAGVMEYGHKTGGTMILVPKSSITDHQKKIRRKSYGSNLNFVRC